MDKCILCKSSKKDDIQYGEFLRNKQFGVHTFCLYLSSNLTQNGNDDEGFLGFLEADIKKEVARVSLLKCCYCSEKYANIGCCDRKCRNTFHLICGLKNYAENQFCNDFRSYCHRHVRKTKQRPSSTETCLICYDNLCTPGKKFNSVNMILTPCCRNGWFHKLCLQKFAKTAGYFFKCPLCNDADVFREKLPVKGIFIPNQDAAWELEPNAFAELLERPNTCSALECKNNKGRTDKSDQNPFVFCSTCGSIAMHKRCLLAGVRSFHCSDCTVAIEEGDSGRESFNSNNGNEENDYIDVCHVSDKEDIETVKRLTDTTTSKQDSNFHNNESTQVSCSTSRGMRILSSEEEQSDYKITQANNTNKRKMRIRSDTETSENSQKDEQIKPTSSKHIRCQRIESQSQESETFERQTTFNKDLEEDVKPSCTQNILRIKTDSESSETLFSQYTSRKRKTFKISSDSEDDKEHSTAKQTRLDCKPKAKECFSENQTSDETSDVDPLEQFDKHVEKQNNISCIALRTRRKSQNLQKNIETLKLNDKGNNKDNPKLTTHSTNRNSNKNNVLDISCIAKRTRRRKTIHTTTIRNEMPYLQQQTLKENQQNPLDISCIAKRTRRKTICAQTSQECFQQQQSKIYEQLNESESDYDNTTDDESLSSLSDTETVTDLNGFIVDDGYEEKDTRFDLSCIANRTRKRKSLRQPNISTILEEPDEYDSSSTFSSSSTYLKNFIRIRKRSRQRILSTSSEEPNTAPSNSKQIGQYHNTKFLTKMSEINIDNYLKPKYTESLHNYHPNNRQRKRL